MQNISLLHRSMAPLHHLRDAHLCSSAWTGPQPQLPERDRMLLLKAAQMALAQARTTRSKSPQQQPLSAQVVLRSIARLCAVPHGMLDHMCIA